MKGTDPSTGGAQAPTDVPFCRLNWWEGGPALGLH